MCLEQLILPAASNWLSELPPLLVAIIKSNFPCPYSISSTAYRASQQEGWDSAPALSLSTPGEEKGRGVRLTTANLRDIFPRLHGGGIESMSNTQLQKLLIWKEFNFFFFNRMLDPGALDTSKIWKALASFRCSHFLRSS